MLAVDFLLYCYNIRLNVKKIVVVVFLELYKYFILLMYSANFCNMFYQ